MIQTKTITSQISAIGKRITGEAYSPASGVPATPTRRAERSRLPVPEVVGAGKRGAHLGLAGGPAGERAERLDLVDEDVLVAADALEAAAGEQERLAADDRAVGVVDGRAG